MRQDGVIAAQAFVLIAEALGFEACFFVLIRTNEHEAEWQAAFLEALNGSDEVRQAHRHPRDIDYIFKIRVRNAHKHDIYPTIHI